MWFNIFIYLSLLKGLLVFQKPCFPFLLLALIFPFTLSIGFPGTLTITLFNCSGLMASCFPTFLTHPQYIRFLERYTGREIRHYQYCR
ncbi:hypothetical protein B9Z19DRAFT_754088 [Tuber borchii]|uniref:Uncharacterized protein n=1 Tax=Tuber borchii TaxID=42251 RepID=A0A2T7A7W9_TUBBO|nr:hypothetical protein B9Z19DRAFT_754088 [Tuber borchii]